MNWPAIIARSFKVPESAPPRIGVAVITHTARKLLPSCLPPLMASPLRPHILLVNSSSGDGTVELAQEMGIQTLVVPRREFNHGLTREKARHALGTPIAVMITPDAIATGPDMLDKLVQPLLDDPMVGVSYARQLPHIGAGFLESFPRRFNYPAQSQVRTLADVPTMGPAAYFCSDSCAAWSNAALDAIGGFDATLTAEDAIAAAKLIGAGYKVAYAASAMVRHSHHYTVKQEFRRYFDTGLMRRQYRDLLLAQAGDEGRGASFVGAMLRALWKERPALIPYALLQSGAKYLGYKAGYHGARLPLAWKKKLSSQDFYWNSTVFRG